MDYKVNGKFGVEIEFLNESLCGGYVNSEEIAMKMTSRGVRCNVEGYNHIDKTFWKMTRDGSCGLELVSPPLTNDRIWELKVACDVLREVGAKVDKRCGLHVHHDASAMTLRNFKNLFLIYVRYEKTIDSFMANSRRGDNNHYCNSMLTNVANNSHPQRMEVVNAIMSSTTLEEIVRKFSCGSRYVKLNGNAFVRHGTIEFRQHQGSLNYDKIMNWALLTEAMVERAKLGSVKAVASDKADTFSGMVSMLNLNKCKGADESKSHLPRFYKKRIEEFIKLPEAV